MMYLWPRHLLPPVGRALVRAVWFALAVPFPLVVAVKRATVKAARLLSPRRVQNMKVMPLCLNSISRMGWKPKAAEQTFPSFHLFRPPVGGDVCLKMDSWFCSWMQACNSGPIFTRIRGYNERILRERERDGENALSVWFDVSGSTLCPSLGRGEGGAAASQGHLD